MKTSFLRVSSEETPNRRRTLVKVATGTLLSVSATLLALNIFGSQEQKVNQVMNLASFNQFAPKGQVNLYGDTRFEGRKISLYPGYKGNLGNLNPGFNDQLSSIQIGSGLRVLFCSNNNCAGNGWDEKFELLGPYNAQDLSVNDWVSYVEVYSYDEKKDPRVMLLGAGDFNIDRSGTFPPGTYMTNDIMRNGIDRPGYGGGASGIVIPSNLIAYLYKGDFLEGEVKAISGPAQIDLIKYENGAWNDRIGSMVIAKVSDTPITISGSWEKVVSSNDAISIQVEETAGIDTTKTNSQEISTSLTAGFEVGGDAVGYKYSISATVGTAISKSVASTLSKSGKFTIQATCSNPSRVKMTLWQWRMTGVKNNQLVMDMKDNEFICKTGEQAPRCPVGFCQDDECNYCKSGLYQ
ncbi:UNKNOWN [Stylonychia lemnae]|uniref:Beta/gamma crystallin 'Greek key' domain-containing protein n=1 Tax=Stylonychia lemnae TaxID=5949 RepID=A0A078ASJ4_STYLE|nr:UNKNOWN [Stylonychia lemnae]|eukprot:CDW85430.1 UNKNOWN [Stylonychia lemnae]